MANDRYHAAPDEYRRQAEKSISNALAEERITQDDAEHIENFILSLSNAGISAGRAAKLTSLLVNVRRYYDKEYRACGKHDLSRAIGRIREAMKPDGTPYSRNTKTDYLKISKRFFLWLQDEGVSEIPKKEIDKIVIGSYDMHCKTEADVLTAEEITSIINAARTSKYKAYFSLLYETGARSIELANLKWQDVTFETYGAIVRLTDNKAGSSPSIRSVPVITYANYLAQWQADYTGDPSGNNFVFITTGGKPLQYRGVSKALSRFTKEAGVKPCTLHQFRHSRVTHAIQGGMSETVAKKCFWNNEGTDMIKIYSHLTDDDVKREFMRQAGVEVESEHVTHSPQPIQCTQCHFVNVPESRFCARCGLSLSPEAIGEYDQAIRFVDEQFTKLSNAEQLELMAEMARKAEEK